VTESSTKGVLELGERKRFHEVRSGPERECLLLSREDAGEDDRTAELPQPAGKGKPVGVPRLDHRRVDVGRAGAVQLGDHRLVPGTSDDVLEERTDVSMGLDDQDPRHGLNILRGRRYPVTLRV